MHTDIGGSIPPRSTIEVNMLEYQFLIDQGDHGARDIKEDVANIIEFLQLKTDDELWKKEVERRIKAIERKLGV